MLHRSPSAVVPYLYIVIGSLTAFTTDSQIIQIASLLLVTAGVITILMSVRFDSSVTVEDESIEMMSDLAERLVPEEDQSEKRSGSDRRQNNLTSFPLVDSEGQVVRFDRRRRDRRQQMVPGFA